MPMPGMPAVRTAKSSWSGYISITTGSLSSKPYLCVNSRMLSRASSSAYGKIAADSSRCRRNKMGRVAIKWEFLRYIHFGASLLLVLVLWFFFQYRPNPMGQSDLIWLVGGNTFYFVSAIILAFMLKDNRAFCKYICPITTILKITSRFSLLKIEGDREKCTQCCLCTS